MQIQDFWLFSKRRIEYTYISTRLHIVGLESRNATPYSASQLTGLPKVSPVKRYSSCLFILPLLVSVSFAEEPDAVGLKFFETKIRPALLEHCADCHGVDEQESELRLDTPAHLMAGGQSGPVAIPGKPGRSLLVSAIRYKDENLQMPPDEKLPASVIADLVKWIEMGAPMPKSEMIAKKTRIPFDLDKAREHWSFQVPQRPALPAGDDVSNPIDKLVFAKLKEKGLTPAAPVSKRTLLRRTYLDLIGLPPTPEQIQAFLSDESPDAFSKVVDELLESPHYGERWGRHWLDIARYADSNGLDENVAHGNAWRYRDYVIAAFNSDKPFDQFIREQLAGDLLDGDEKAKHERLIATGFLSLGPKVLAEVDETKMEMDIIDEQIDTTGRVFLSLTFGCARCHDHKFDPIRADDYYALAGIFKSTTTMESFKKIAIWNENIIASPEQLKEKEKHDGQVTALETEIAALTKQEADAKKVTKPVETTTKVDATGEKKTEVTTEEPETPAETSEAQPTVAEQLKTLKANLKELKTKAPELPSAMGVTEAKPTDVPIHVRGSHLSLGRDVSRGMPLVLCIDEPELQAPGESGRLELANWLASPTHPLTSRVWVNRVWRWHFGTGLVSTTDNFGILGLKPTHPKLLDWLAVEFVENGWSTKELHRLILLSKTYQMSSAFNEKNAAIDLENQYHWRTKQLRMEAEVFRDSLLAVSGQLDTTMGGSMLHVKNREFIFNHTSKDETNYDSNRRSIYLPVIRNNLYDGFSLFDYTDASVSNSNRDTSTVAPQALYALNSDVVLTAAEQLAKQLQTDAPDDTSQRIRSLFEKAYGRLPTPQETATISHYITQLIPTVENELSAWTVVCQTILISNEFIYVQ